MCGSTLRFNAARILRNLDDGRPAEHTGGSALVPNLHFPPDFGAIREGLPAAVNVGGFLRIPPPAVPEIAHLRRELGQIAGDEDSVSLLALYRPREGILVQRKPKFVGN